MSASWRRFKAPFPRITYDEAITLLQEQGQEIQWGEDFGAPHETAIAAAYDRPVFITHYPASFKAFYMKPDPNRPEVVLCADMIAPEGYGEIIGGSQRIDDPELLAERFAEHELSTRRTNGIWTCVNTARCLIPASDLAWSGR